MTEQKYPELQRLTEKSLRAHGGSFLLGTLNGFFAAAAGFAFATQRPSLAIASLCIGGMSAVFAAVTTPKTVKDTIEETANTARSIPLPHQEP